jgi:hypothetical protein
VLGDVGQPLEVRRRGGEIVGRAAVVVGDLEKVVVDRWPGLAASASTLGV